MESCIEKNVSTRKAMELNGLVAEYLKHGGPVLIVWLKRNLNAIINLQKIPASQKLRVIVPVFNGRLSDCFPIKRGVKQ